MTRFSVAWLLLFGLCLPQTGWAQTKSSDTPTITQIKKDIKSSILEGYRHQDEELYWSIFTDDIVFVDGRSLTPDEHDIRRTRKQEEQRRAILAKGETDSQRDVFFRHIKATEEAEKITLKVELVFHYFGGNRLEGRVYTLRKTKGTWLVHHLRRWVLHEAMGPDIRTFDALYFKHADEDAKEALENEALDLHDRLTKLVRAKWIPSAFKLAQKSTQATPKSASAWSALGALAFEMGELSISRKAIQKALNIDPEFGVPTLLKP